MVNSLFVKLTLRELKKNWFQYLSMFLITVLAVTLFMGFISNKLTLRRRAELYYEKVNLADLAVQTTGFTAEDRAYLNGLGAEYRIFSDGNYYKPLTTVETAKIFVADGKINEPYLTEQKEGAGVYLDCRVAELKGYALGDKITVELKSLEGAFRTAEGQLALLGVTKFEPVFEFEVVGLMHSVEVINIYSVSPVYIPKETFRSALTQKALAALGEAGSAYESLVRGRMEQFATDLETQALLRCEDGERTKGEISRYFEGAGNKNLVVVQDHKTMEAVNTLDSEVEQSANMIYIFPVIFFLVSVLVVMTSISRLILRERTAIGTFKALGIPNSRIVWHYALLSAAITLVGCILGCVLGPLIVPNVMGIKYTLTFSMPMLAGIRFSFLWSAASSLTVTLCSLLIGVWAAHSAVKENPAECMRPKAVHYAPRTKKKEVQKEAGRARLSANMALRNIRINPWRALMTVLGVMGCTALLVTSFGIGDTLNASVQNDYGKLFYFDVTCPYSQAVYEEAQALEEEALAQKEELLSQYVVTASFGDRNKDISVYLVEENSAMTEMTKKGNTLSRVIASSLGVDVGDEVQFTMSGGSVRYRVEHIEETATFNGFFTRRNLFSEELGVEPAAKTIWLKTASPEACASRLNERAGSEVAKTMAGRMGEIENLISSTKAMKYTVMAFAVLLSIVVLYNLSLLNLKERNRDMATLKVLGFTHFEVSLSLFIEIALLTALGVAAGCLFGYPLLYLVMKMNEVSAMAFIYALQPVSYLYSVLISLGTCALINLLFGFLISKISMTESLKSVE